VRQYSAIAAFCSRVPTPMIHITRKNAIIAVTKSAYATFHAPPWWPWEVRFTRLMITSAEVLSPPFMHRLRRARP